MYLYTGLRQLSVADYKSPSMQRSHTFGDSDGDTEASERRPTRPLREQRWDAADLHPGQAMMRASARDNNVAGVWSLSRSLDSACNSAAHQDQTIESQPMMQTRSAGRPPFPRTSSSSTFGLRIEPIELPTQPISLSTGPHQIADSIGRNLSPIESRDQVSQGMSGALSSSLAAALANFEYQQTFMSENADSQPPYSASDLVNDTYSPIMDNFNTGQSDMSTDLQTSMEQELPEFTAPKANETSKRFLRRLSFINTSQVGVL
jgi:hypothetical protein